MTLNRTVLNIFTVKLYLLCILFVCTIVSYGSKRPKIRTHELQWNTEKSLSSWSWQPFGNYHKGRPCVYTSPSYLPNGISQPPPVCNWVWHCITWDFIFRLAVIKPSYFYISQQTFNESQPSMFFLVSVVLLKSDGPLSNIQLKKQRCGSREPSDLRIWGPKIVHFWVLFNF